MNYAIRLQTKGLEAGMKHYLMEPVAMLSEHDGQKNNQVLKFPTRSDAEIYAQDHEIKNYEVEIIP